MSPATAVFLAPNPYALERIALASQSCRLVAARPIYDDRGTLLWAQDKPITRSLHERLLARKLREPLEACLRADDGFTPRALYERLDALLYGTSVWARGLWPWAELLLRHAAALPLLPAAQVLLTTAMATMPRELDHALAGAALAGAMQISANARQDDVRLAMLGGLLHDVGDLYVNPDHLASGGALSLEAYRAVVVHPHVGELVLSTFTAYPAALTEAIGQHHERHDGGGYPLRRTHQAMRPLGSLLAMAELALGIAEHSTRPFTQCAIAARVVPGEYDLNWASFFGQLPDSAVVPNDEAEAAALHAELVRLQQTVSGLRDQALALANSMFSMPFVKDIASRVAARTTRLLVGLASVGVGMPGASTPEAQPHLDAGELRPVIAEVRYRLRALRRECMWPHKTVAEGDEAVLGSLWVAGC